jgi:alpha-ketoglutarate-dependent taurine dioxygenase
MLTLKLAVTGWKSVFVNKGFTKRIVELTKDESDVILEYLFKVCIPCFLVCFPLSPHPFGVAFGRINVIGIIVGIAKP